MSEWPTTDSAEERYPPLKWWETLILLAFIGFFCVGAWGGLLIIGRWVVSLF